VVELAGSQDRLLERFEKARLGLGMEVEAMRDSIGDDVVEQRLLQDGMVVTVIERRATREEVQILPPVAVVQPDVFGAGELSRNRAGVAAHLRFAAFVDLGFRRGPARTRGQVHQLAPYWFDWEGSGAMRTSHSVS